MEVGAGVRVGSGVGVLVGTDVAVAAAVGVAAGVALGEGGTEVGVRVGASVGVMTRFTVAVGAGGSTVHAATSQRAAMASRGRARARPDRHRLRQAACARVNVACLPASIPRRQGSAVRG